VERKVLFPCARHGRQSLIDFCAKLLNQTTFSFCTISMHIMLDSCVSNLRCWGWMEHTQMYLALNKGTKHFHYTSNFWGIFSEFAILLDKNSNGGYEGPSIL
jgi:hypothetical protein